MQIIFFHSFRKQPMKEQLSAIKNEQGLTNFESLSNLSAEALALLTRLIAIPSFSKAEAGTADVLQQFLQQKGIIVHRKLNNVWAKNIFFDSSKPTLLLNSHHDTVKP